MADTFELKKGCILTMKYNGVVGENANPGETAWNSFAYQYTAEVNGNEKTLRAEPPKVGVKIYKKPVIEKDVLDAYGNQIILPSNRVATDLVVNQDGTLAFPDGTGNPAVITDANGRPVKFGIYQFNNPAGLSKEGSNNYSVTVASGAAVAENGNAAVKQTKTHQYYTEASNVDVANEMVNLIVAQRAYEMNSKAIQASDEMMQQANALR